MQRVKGPSPLAPAQCPPSGGAQGWVWKRKSVLSSPWLLPVAPAAPGTAVLSHSVPHFRNFPSFPHLWVVLSLGWQLWTNYLLCAGHRARY